MKYFLILFIIAPNLFAGDKCSSDFDCSSLCCNPSLGICQPHEPDKGIYCEKSPGQTCVDRIYCRMENVTECFIVKTGTDPSGEIECALRCYDNPIFGSCRHGICISPRFPPVPDFDPEVPDCKDAIDPPAL
ncbi:MAG: hypothetical protein E2O68_03270 [Deltaproteobacteria bacterium]|nr:MAG: hypothetical protein E2O68_03270 [Deltaproteobacteria bacterium]